ncbi:MAG TPA: SgcJ/EcaC family oxidoreductase [Crenalkalicoccus sp.]|jgi:uncharacterized protein (TIGR02246 family)|nr:SgcJ/EcaC family oxidoreductase [Crenalkalicoccus sp.]
MGEDERAIRDLVALWMRASQAGDLPTVLDLMTDDVVFTVAGREPFGKQAFAEAAAAMPDLRFEGTSEIVELQVLGEWAFIRNRLRITAMPAGGSPVRRSGYTLTLLRRNAAGRWQVARDANLTMPS